MDDRSESGRRRRAIHRSTNRAAELELRSEISVDLSIGGGFFTPTKGRSSRRMGIIQRCAILRKVTFLEQLRSQGNEALGPLSSRLKAIRDDRVVSAHESHKRTTDRICSYLVSRKVQIRLKEQLTDDDVKWAQLVLSVGGDGTFLRASHQFSELDTTPIMGINSSPETSIGFYCAGHVGQFEELFDNVEQGRLQTRPLWRMRLSINQVDHPTLVLNDVLFAANDAASMVYYGIKYGPEYQVQKSSGVWISTPAGSTAGILSAGGCIQPWSSRLLQFRVRELFPPSIGAIPIIGGLFENDLELVPRMTGAKLYMDGMNLTCNVGYNDVIRFRPSERPLSWIASPTCDEYRYDLIKLNKEFKKRCTKANHAFERQRVELLHP